MVNLQQYDMELHLADIISRNPAGLNATEIRNLTKSNTITVNAINLSLDKSLCKGLRNLELQKTDPRIQKIRRRMAKQPTVSDPRYQIVDDTLLYREEGHASLYGGRGHSIHPHKFRPFRGIKMHATDQAGYHLKNLGHKVRKFLACCDTCQRVN